MPYSVKDFFEINEDMVQGGGGGGGGGGRGEGYILYMKK